MPFNSAIFLFIFAPFVIGANALLPSRMRNVFLVLASIAFYAWGEPHFVLVVIASSLIDYGLAAWIGRSTSDRTRRIALTVGVVLNIGLLLYCKYLGFFVENLQALFGALGLPRPDILLPLGISFIVFEKITYIVDVYRRVSAPARSVTDYLLFVFLFPKLLAGPILKFHEMRAQIERHVVTWDDVEQGAFRFAMGLAKKVLIADSVAEIADQVFNIPAAKIGFGHSWLGALCFAVQIYFDFSAYSDMAIGLARTLGFRLRENFNQPYLAIGFTDFWKRWHISLSTWIRDYLYIPLGGSRVSTPRMYLNLWICFLSSGLWHGANWTFVLWGAFHGLFVSADHMGLNRHVWPRLPRAVGIAVTALLVMLGWVIFRATSLGQALTLFSAMLSPARETKSVITVELDSILALAVGVILSVTPLDWARSIADRFAARLWPSLSQIGLLALTVWSFGRVFVSTFKPFIYFRF
ncbi:MBOAT family O-acyltransferase [Microvirga flavescens]|uniref:MBOAT family O-acyltransferase n=1 Tax=Microvirga flavescens TaxID=2249811 RepID=UPI000DDBC304|nr:MBOAT family protein [Microvirga flavescens]